MTELELIDALIRNLTRARDRLILWKECLDQEEAMHAVEASLHLLFEKRFELKGVHWPR
jgi:hypothetical protein